ncbi:MAG: SAM-dependent methyltransferase, partial [Candidatus Shapirobacteria bacterium]
MENSSWQKVSKWYNQSVGDEGHYYHQHVIMPNLKRILNLKDNESLLDLACGQGVLERNMSKG